MPDFKPLYCYSFGESQRLEETEKWRESFEENLRCRDFIDRLVRENFDGKHIKGDIPQKVVAEFGFDRTRWVLANHIQLNKNDGRFNSANIEWASDIFIHRPAEWEMKKNPNLYDNNTSLLLDSHNVLVDYIAGKVQQMYSDLNLYDHRHCDMDSGDYKGNILVLRDTSLNEAHRTPENQLFLAESGFGCSPTASGRAVFGRFLIDGEKTRFERSDFVGVINNNHLPDWAREKIAEIQNPTDEPEAQNGVMQMT